jgi:hypothetical protein
VSPFDIFFFFAKFRNGPAVSGYTLSLNIAIEHADTRLELDVFFARGLFSELRKRTRRRLRRQGDSVIMEIQDRAVVPAKLVRLGDGFAG